MIYLRLFPGFSKKITEGISKETSSRISVKILEDVLEGNTGGISEGIAIKFLKQSQYKFLQNILREFVEKFPGISLVDFLGELIEKY